MDRLEYTPYVRRMPLLADLGAFIPGVALCVAITAASSALQAVEVRLWGRAWIEALVIAILLGTALRSSWRPGARWTPGIHLSAKTLLEIAIVLLGAGVSAGMVRSAGVALLAGIVVIVFGAIGLSYALGRAFGLPRRMATLIACGNSICGNSAIAAVAPVIGAHSDDVGASIAFTAVLGVGVVLLLPVLAGALHLHAQAFGVLAGLTVYAVPQVLAAAAPAGSVAVHIGTYVKLVRVLMLGPVVLVLSLLARRAPGCDAPRASLSQLVPWFIIGFVAMLLARSFGWIPQPLLRPFALASNWLTVVSMAALGLGVDVRSVARAGPRVTAVVTLSLVALGLLAWTLLQLLPIGAR